MKKWILLLALVANTAFGSTTTLKQVDNIQNSTGGSSLSVPGTGSALATDSNTLTLSNKSISGSSNTITNIPASAISSGQLGVANGGTGLATITANSLLVGNGTSAIALIAPGSSGNVLTSNGTAWASSAPVSTAPVLNGSQASPQAVTAGGGISLSGIAYNNVAFITGSGGPVTVTATPAITACTAAGQILTVIGESATNTVTLQDESGVAGAKLHLNGTWVAGLNQILSLMCDGNSFWVEISRQN